MSYNPANYQLTPIDDINNRLVHLYTCLRCGALVLQPDTHGTVYCNNSRPGGHQ